MEPSAPVAKADKESSATVAGSAAAQRRMGRRTMHAIQGNARGVAHALSGGVGGDAIRTLGSSGHEHPSGEVGTVAPRNKPGKAVEFGLRQRGAQGLQLQGDDRRYLEELARVTRAGHRAILSAPW